MSKASSSDHTPMASASTTSWIFWQTRTACNRSTRPSSAEKVSDCRTGRFWLWETIFDATNRLNAAWLKTHRRWKSCISHFGQIKVAPPASNSRKNWKAPVSERSHSKAVLPAYRWLEASWRRRNKKTFRTWRICKQAANLTLDEKWKIFM